MRVVSMIKHSVEISIKCNYRNTSNAIVILKIMGTFSLPIRCFRDLICVGIVIISSSSPLEYIDHGHANHESSAVKVLFDKILTHIRNLWIIYTNLSIWLKTNLICILYLDQAYFHCFLHNHKEFRFQP